MSSRRGVVLLAIVAIAGLTIAPVASGAVMGTFATDESGDDEEQDTTVSTFMQASAADTKNEVEAGMFESAYENADDESQAELVADRTADLETTFAELEEEREVLQESNDELSNGQYQARMVRLTVEINALDRSIERTKHRAADAGVDNERLETLQENASELAGPEIAATAQGIAGHDRAFGQGPLDETGAIDDGDDHSQNEHLQPGLSAQDTDAVDGSDGEGGQPDDIEPKSNGSDTLQTDTETASKADNEEDTEEELDDGEGTEEELDDEDDIETESDDDGDETETESDDTETESDDTETESDDDGDDTKAESDDGGDDTKTESDDDGDDTETESDDDGDDDSKSDDTDDDS